MDSTSILMAIISAVAAGIVGYFFSLKKKDKDNLDQVTIDFPSMKEKLRVMEQKCATLELALQNSANNLEASFTKKLDDLEKKSISEQKVREWIVEETKEFRSEIKALSELISNLRIDLGILNYIKNKESLRDD